MNATELRQTFLEFFEERGHEIVPSASLIPHDPSVLFTIAGMVPFKPYFVGDETPPWSRATSVQKCFRTVDIDIVGTTSRHCTFFEMLGNFSFGDYFKEKAIEMAWEFITKTLAIDPGKLWVTVHESDDEAEVIWRDHIGVDAQRIQRMGEDNFWRMGDTGPCGPCSEIYYDKGEAYGPDGGPAHGGEERFVEVWNLVFMEFNRNGDGTLSELPKKNIDTGAGLERLVPILNGTDSIFATDIFAGHLHAAELLTNKTYGEDEEDDVALRIMADHGRAMTLLVSDGVLPSNEGRGYVLRRIVRRAVMAARQAGATDLVTPSLITATLESLGAVYTKLTSDEALIRSVLLREEEGFDRTLKAGMALLEDATERLEHGGQLPGDIAFRLHDTHGFPIELTEELARGRSLIVDRTSFDLLMAEQRDRARAAARTPRVADEDGYRSIIEIDGPSEFVGRVLDEPTVTAHVVAVLAGADGISEIFLDRTPFYAEGGGQVGDIGVISSDTSSATVIDTIAPLPGLHAHRCLVEGEFFVGQEVTATIDTRRREAIRRNHTATHLLHWALREVLGDHVRQQGSLVDADRLRFDFSHHEAPSPEQLDEVTRLVNREVVSGRDVETAETSRSDAEKMGAIAFFGDKYGESVRVVKAGDHSLEFCGGTHVESLGQIGSLQVVAEGSIGSNTRRIEAVTGLKSVERFLEQQKTLDAVGASLRAESGSIIEAVDRAISRTKEIEKERDGLRQASLAAEVDGLLSQVADGVVITTVASRPADDVRQLAATLQRKGSLRAAIIGSIVEDKVAVAVATQESLDARTIVKAIGHLIAGGGGGSPTLALAGGKNPSGLSEALSAAQELVS